MNWFQCQGENLANGTAFCLKGAVIVWVILALASVFLITPNTDETWILLALRSFLEPPIADYSIEPVPTSGGLFLLVNILLESLFGSIVWVHRLFSFFCFVALLGLILWQAEGPRPMTSGLLAVAPARGSRHNGSGHDGDWHLDRSPPVLRGEPDLVSFGVAGVRPRDPLWPVVWAGRGEPV